MPATTQRASIRCEQQSEVDIVHRAGTKDVDMDIRKQKQGTSLMITIFEWLY